MAATGKTPILLYGSTTPTNSPTAGNLTNSSDGCEIAINVADKNLFFKDATNAVNTVPIRQSSASSNGWLSSTDWSTFNSKAPAFTYTTGYIPFGQGTTTPTQSANLFWDNSNIRLGVGNNAPANTLDITGSVNSVQARFGNVAGRGLEISTTLTGGVNDATSVLNAKGASYGNLKLQTDSTDRLTIDNVGNATVSTGNLVIGTSGKGIDFSATPGTGTSELLADYEEGTWTPTDQSGAGLTFTQNVTAIYVKVGKLVHCSFDITFPSTASTAFVNISLPYTSLSGSTVGGSVGYQTYGAWIGIDGSGSTFNFYIASGAALQNVNMSGKRIQACIVYESST